MTTEQLCHAGGLAKEITATAGEGASKLWSVEHGPMLRGVVSDTVTLAREARFFDKPEGTDPLSLDGDTGTNHASLMARLHKRLDDTGLIAGTHLVTVQNGRAK